MLFFSAEVEWQQQYKKDRYTSGLCAKDGLERTLSFCWGVK